MTATLQTPDDTCPHSNEERREEEGKDPVIVCLECGAERPVNSKASDGLPPEAKA